LTDNRKRELREHAAFEALLPVAEDYWGYPIELPLDKACTVLNYLHSGFAEVDRLVAEIQVGKRSPNEVLKWQKSISLRQII